MTGQESRPPLASLSRPWLLMAGSAALALLGCFLPWAQLLAMKVYGFKTDDGKIVIAATGIFLAVIVLEHAPQRGRNRSRIALGGIAGVLALAVAAYDWNDFAAIGLWLVLFGGIGMVAGVIWALATGEWASRSGG